MRLDSEEQRQMLLTMLGKFPVHTDLDGLYSGVSPRVAALMDAIRKAPLDLPKPGNAEMTDNA